MKKENIKFMKRMVLLIVIIILIILILNIIYTKYVLTKKNFYRKEIAYQNYISNHSEIKYAFFGDSHTFHAIHPKFISGAFNFGSGTENYIKTYYLLERIINKDNIKVGTIVLQADLETFSTWLTNEPFLFNEIELYSQFVPLSKIKEVRKKDSMIELFIEAKLPVIGKGKEFGILFSNENLSEMYEGWIKNYNDFSNLTETERLNIAEDGYKVHFQNQQISNLSIEYFIKTMELAKKNNINVILVKYPISKEYQDITSQRGIYNISKEEYYRILFDNTEKVLGDNYYVLDYQNLFLNQPEDLGDTYHVNYKGAEILSRKIYEDITKLNLSSNSSSQQQNNVITIDKNTIESDKINLILVIFLTLESIILLGVLIYLMQKTKFNKSSKSFKTPSR